MDKHYASMFGYGTCVFAGVLEKERTDDVLRRYISIKLAPLFLEVDFANVGILKYANSQIQEKQKHVVYELTARSKEGGEKMFGLVSMHFCEEHSLGGWKVNAHTNFVKTVHGFINRESSLYPATAMFNDRDVEPVCGC
jgi:hypothetical protein